MATAGHFVTMVGVIAFYAMIFDSHKEKKISIALSSLLPRINKRALYYLHKIVFLALQAKSAINLPSKTARLHILANNIINFNFEIYEMKLKV